MIIFISADTDNTDTDNIINSFSPTKLRWKVIGIVSYLNVSNFEWKVLGFFNHLGHF